MLEAIVSYRYIWDTLDIVIVALILFYILNIIEGTRAAQILLGLTVVFFLYFFSQKGGLFTLNWILDHFLSSIILIAVILFQNDIRKALASLGKRPLFLSLYRGISEHKTIDEVVKATTYMASRKNGALIAIERRSSLEDFVELGMRLDSYVSRELIISIFNTESPLHDGGIIIGDNRIRSAGSFFPLDTDPDLDRDLGTRHRAAIGIASETDAVVVVVSEESGIISLAYDNEIKRGLDATALNNTLSELLDVKSKKADKSSFLYDKINIIK